MDYFLTRKPFEGQVAATSGGYRRPELDRNNSLPYHAHGDVVDLTHDLDKELISPASGDDESIWTRNNKLSC
jgi:hypothetical protein